MILRPATCKKSSLLICCVLYHFLVVAQDKFITISGTIHDAPTGTAIPAVSIRLVSGKTGTATNNTGDFILKLPVAAGTDTVMISCIGYVPVRVPVSYFSGKRNLSLQPAAVELASVTVTTRNGLDILKEAMARVPENYDTADAQLTAFYREDVRLDSFQITFAEAVLDIHKTFKTAAKLNDRIRIVKGRKKKVDYGADAQLYYWMSGTSNGPRGSLSEDLVKYQLAKNSPFNPSNFRLYEYRYAGAINEGSRQLLLVDVLPRKRARKAYLQLRVFVDQESAAIVKYNMELSSQGIRHVYRKDNGILQRIMKAVVHANMEYHRFNYVINYTQYNNKWYLNRVNRHFEILVNSKRRNWENKLWRSDMELLITDIRTDSIQPILEGDISGKDGPIHTMIGSDFDEAFWENYNVVKSEKPDSLKQVLTDSSLLQRIVDSPANLPGQTNDTMLNRIKRFSNRDNGFTRADTLRGKLTPLRTCYDVTFYHLDVTVDPETRSVAGSNLLRFRVEQPFQKMQVDLFENMKISSIRFENRELSFTREFSAVYVDFPRMMKKGEMAEVKIFYEGVPKVPDFSIPMDGGILWDKDSTGNTWAQVVCQGSGASLWWPNKDHQSDEPDSMKIWITVPEGFTEISNGRLQQITPLANKQSRYEWLVSYPINNYNVTFSFGKYVHFKDSFVSDDTLTIDYYVMPYNLERAKNMFRQVKPMLRTFEKNFGKYPFPRDGFTLVESLYPMEHQSGVCIGRITQENSGDTNPLLWHESAHEWWGNSITSKDIADMWIHEAFATYAENMVLEDLYGKELATDALLKEAEAVKNREPVTGEYDVNHIHYDIGDMYAKGAMILHTFRNVLNNDNTWRKLLHEIQRKFRHQAISADELIVFINNYLRHDYTAFFKQYLRYPALPKLEVVLTEKGKDLQVKYRWKTAVSGFDMPARITVAPGKFDLVYPAANWKTIVMKNMLPEDFDVDDEYFFIEADIQ